MFKAPLRIIATFLLFVVFFQVQKLLFLGLYAQLYVSDTFGEFWGVFRHGFAMDCTVAGYLTVVPAIGALLSVFSSNGAIRSLLKWYSLIVAVIVSIIFVVDLALYGYWGFRLDTTPLFYVSTSPSAAMASVSWWQGLVGCFTVVADALVLYSLMNWVARLTPVLPVAVGRSRAVALALLFVFLLFIPIRGGVTVSTMNLSTAYFSSKQRLNHAAVNPVFSLLYSSTHQADFGKQYQSYEPEVVEQYFTSNLAPLPCSGDSSLVQLAKVGRPDICLVILESFSAHLLPSLGGDSIAMRLDSIASGGILFSRFYANSFRTDRALPAILSGWPAQPSTSIMKFASKAEHLPSWPRRLVGEGYSANYYYGGDINFTNMLAYLRSSGFENIIRDKDFPLHERVSKWGAHDHVVFDRAANDLISDTSATPRLTVVQTSSSHEPFEVPYVSSRGLSPEANAFAYADSCLGVFVDRIKASPRWDRTLLVIVPDHYGAWPKGLVEATDRHHVPLVIAGGALAIEPGVVDRIGSQTDIAATLLTAVGVPSDEFEFSNDLICSGSRRQALLADPSEVTLVCDTAVMSWQCDASSKGTSPAHPDPDPLKAYLQVLYRRMDSL